MGTYQRVTGALMANSHPGSYCGQDAYNDMFVTESIYEKYVGWNANLPNPDGKQFRGGAENAGQR